ncbi:MAG: glycosyltransferase family 39 protein [Lachnospiraceae bacterium]|nr:glycosyltransferase family 39 protein [Lachnospiraceae bacterium]
MSKFLNGMQRGIWTFIAGLCVLFSAYVLFSGSAQWTQDCSVYANMPVWPRTVLLLLSACAVCGLFYHLGKRYALKGEKSNFLLALAILLITFVLQCVYVVHARALIRYDALNVYTEALALFSQKGIGAEDLQGYFARYSNNTFPVIVTHWILKVLRLAGIVKKDFENGVLVLQIVNVIATDVSYLGVILLLKRYAGASRAALFSAFMLFYPFTYVWMPFFYTNTLSMPFAVWFVVFFFYGLEKARQMQHVLRMALSLILSALCFSVGYRIRPTVIIVAIAAWLVVFLADREKERERKQAVHLLTSEEALSAESIASATDPGKTNTESVPDPTETAAGTACGAFLVAFLVLTVILLFVLSIFTKRYLAFDQKETEFPAVHWIAMGLSDTGTFSPADEAYSMSFATAAERKEADWKLLKERLNERGAGNVAKLYLQKLALTFGDGCGGYIAECNRSETYGMLWDVVYGVHRDGVMLIYQAFYLATLLCMFLGNLLLCKDTGKERPPMRVTFLFFSLVLLGSFLFQMIWEAGTVYSIGISFANGVMPALVLPALYERSLSGKEIKLPVKIVGVLLSVASIIVWTVAVVRTDYVDVVMSVDQYLYIKGDAVALTDGQTITQSFTTDKAFGTIALMAENPEGEYNDSVYEVMLIADDGAVLETYDLAGAEVVSNVFYPIWLSDTVRPEKESTYSIRLTKKSGTNDLIFLYYDTGLYDAYPFGKMEGDMVVGEHTDLTFEVYWREERFE